MPLESVTDTVFGVGAEMIYFQISSRQGGISLYVSHVENLQQNFTKLNDLNYMYI